MGEHRPDDFEGDDGETLVREEGVKEPPPAPDVNKSMLDRGIGVSQGVPFAIALGLHVAVFAAALFLPGLLSRTPPLRKPIIARMVALGKPRDQKLLPRKEEPAAPPPSAPRAVPQPIAPAPAAPLPKAPSKIASAAPAPKAPAQKPLSRQEMMERALAGVGANVEQERKDKPPEEREGSEKGSTEGTAATEEEGDQYFAAVQAAILAHYVLPSIISERDRMSLKATVVAYIARDGTIIRYEFEKRSGNKFFDDALELALKRSKVPPPPSEREKMVRDGVALVFTP